MNKIEEKVELKNPTRMNLKLKKKYLIEKCLKEGGRSGVVPMTLHIDRHLHRD